MADSAAAAGEAGICVCCVSILNAFCFLKPYGMGSSTSAPCGGPRGCCGSCLESGDEDEDDFERAQRKERERKQKKNGQREQEGPEEEAQQGEANGGIVDNQPAPASEMQPPAHS